MKNIILLLLIFTSTSMAYTLKDIKNVCVEMEPNYTDDEYFDMVLEMNGIETTASINILRFELVLAETKKLTQGKPFVNECVKGLKLRLDEAKSK